VARVLGHPERGEAMVAAMEAALAACGRHPWGRPERREPHASVPDYRPARYPRPRAIRPALDASVEQL